MGAKGKFSKAIEAMAPLEFPEETVRTTLQDLLKKCKRKWKLIEEDNYYMLVDAIIKTEQERKEEGKELQKLSGDESKDHQPLTRSKLKARSSASAPECNVQDMGSPPHDEHKIAYSAREHANYKYVGVMNADIWKLGSTKGHGSPKSLSQLKPIVETKLLSGGTLDNEAKDTSLGYSSVKRRSLAIEESIHSANSSHRDFISVVFPSPEVKSPDPLALIRQEQGDFEKIMDKNYSRSSGTNLLEMMNVDDEFDSLPSPPCEESVIIKGKDTHLEDEMGNANLDLVPFSSIPDSPFEPCTIANTLDLTHCNYDMNLKAILNGESNEVDHEPSNGSSTPSSLMIIRSENQYFVEDITRGVEEKVISLINEVNSEEMPSFRYIPRSIPYCNARVKFPLAHISNDNCCSSCLGDCLSSRKPCLCEQKSVGGFAYGTGGVVKAEFIDKFCPLERLSGQCKGHVIQNFIKECWYKCGCIKTCGNRTVQQGITAKLQVFMTPEGKGWGLRTLEDLPKGAFVCEYVGEILTTMELVERNLENTGGSQQAYIVLLDANWRSNCGLKDEEALCLDGESYGNVSRFINHRCHDANMIKIPVEVETPDHNYYHVAFFTTRKVKAMEELTWDYGINFGDDRQAHKLFQCYCCSDFCRGKKRVQTSDICAREPSSERRDVIQYYRKRSRAVILVD